MTIQENTPEETLENIFVRQLRDRRASLRTLLAIARRMRASCGEQEDLLDRVLVKEYRSLQKDCAEMRKSQIELRELVEAAMSPPWYPALFLGLVDTERGPLARVRHNSDARLVSVARDVDAKSLRRGDEVYLSEQQNLLVYKATGGQLDHGGVATVERRLDDGRLCVKDRETEYIVSASQALLDEPPGVGDRVRWFEPAMLAVEKLPGDDAAQPFLVEEVSDTPPQQLGGMDRERDRMIGRYVKHAAYPDVASEYGVDEGNRRLLMEGPPGCGKTLLARVLASAIKKETGRAVRLAIVSGSALYDPYVGQTERNIAALFKVPPEFDGTSVIFLDELDAIGRARGGVGNVHADRFLSTLLAELEGFAGDRSVVVMAATNRAEMLDAALLERFAYRMKVDRPNRAAARDIFGIYLPENLPVRPNGEAREETVASMVASAVALLYDDNADNQVARLQFRDGKTRPVFARELLSGRLIEQISLAARQYGFERHVSGGEPGIVVEDMRRAVGEAISRLGNTLSVTNVHCHLADLGTEMDVIRVDPVVRRVQPELYLQ